MSKYNKTELDSYIGTYIVPMVTNAIHIDVLENFTDSAVLKKKRYTSASMSSNSYTLNFENMDMYDINCNSRDMSFTFSNLSEGQQAYVKFTDVGSLSFTNAVLVGNNRDNGNCPTFMNTIIYRFDYVRGGIFGKFEGIETNLVLSSFDFDDFHLLAVDFKVKSVVTWTNGPFSSGGLYIMHLRTFPSVVYNTNEYTTMYELTLCDYNAGNVRKFVGFKEHTSSIAWTELT